MGFFDEPKIEISSSGQFQCFCGIFGVCVCGYGQMGKIWPSLRSSADGRNRRVVFFTSFLLPMITDTTHWQCIRVEFSFNWTLNRHHRCFGKCEYWVVQRTRTRSLWCNRNTAYTDRLHMSALIERNESFGTSTYWFSSDANAILIIYATRKNLSANRVATPFSSILPIENSRVLPFTSLFYSLRIYNLPIHYTYFAVS